MQISREQFGNEATESGAVEGGADASELNRGVLPEGREKPVEVDAEYVPGDGITLTPKEADFGRALSELKEGPLDLLSAQLTEEPEMAEVKGIEVYGGRSRLAQITRRQPKEMLVWYGMHPEYDGAMSGSRIMLRRDVLESQYSCKTCAGRGYEEETACGLCAGSTEETINEQPVPCRACRVSGFQKEAWFSSGRKRCVKCYGSGWRNGVVIPEESQTQAITGVVVSVGPLVTMWKIGDRLIFSRFAGHTLDVSKTESFVMMDEKEALGILRQKSERPKWRER